MVVTLEENLFTVTFLCLLSLQCLADGIVHVDKHNGTESPSCLGSQNVACKTIEYISNKLNGNCSNLTVKFVDKQINLDSIISFENCSTLLTIEGNEIMTTSVLCSGANGGFQFRNVSNLTLLNVKIISCGFNIHQDFNDSSAMHIYQCVNILLQNITFTDSISTALVISETSGNVQIRESYFLNKTKKEQKESHKLFPGGIYVQFTHIQDHTSYIITNCTFENNKKEKVLHPMHSNPAVNSYGLGGGMGILFMDTNHSVSVLIEMCRFLSNRAHTGAGLYIHFRDRAEQNVVRVVGCTFVANEAIAGGGLSIAMDKLPHNAGNYVYVNDSTFSNNTAHYGGGTVLYTFHSNRPNDKNLKLIIFYNNTWEYNHGQYSPAVDISAFRSDQYNIGYLPIPIFKDCSFNNNVVLPTHVGNKNTTYNSSGAVVFTSSTVYFEGVITFTKNRFTALKLVSSKVRLKKGTQLNFTSNEGVKGGAIALYGFSALAGNRDCNLLFFNNSATEIGGGLFHQTIEERDYIEGDSCFLQYAGNSSLSVHERNLTFKFTDNSATNGGSDIYSASLYACFFAYLGNIHNHNLSDFLKYIGTFQFSESLDTLGTDGVIYNYESRGFLSVIPGETVVIPISVSNEFKKKTNTQLLVTNEVYPSTEIFHNTETKVFGTPDMTTSLLFKTQNMLRNSYYRVQVKFTDCPPAYYFDNDTHSCNCSADNPRKSYILIKKCNNTAFRAIITKGFWVGTHEYNKTKILFTSSSARTYAYPDSETILNYAYMLPKDKNDLESFMCGKKKQGILCGKCTDNYTAYYHSRNYICESKKYCNLGILFYLISEIFPVVILFIIVIHFNINFTSGWLNGMIFYCQVVDLFSIDTRFLEVTSTKTRAVFAYLQDGYRLIYGILNFEFFQVDLLSFCLWNGAGIMDVIAVKYMTTLFTFVLVLILVRLMKVNCKCCKKYCQIEHSVTQGFSAFLIICYSQYSRITFQILSRQSLIATKELPTVFVTEYGGLEYFSPLHLLYAIPALFVLCTLVFLPILYLLLVPLILKLLHACNLSEHPCVENILKLMWQTKLMPIMDTFQSCFKDRLRFFAGVYFAYRLSILAALTFSTGLVMNYTASEFTLILILGVHAIAQPYTNSNHNLIDGVLFLNLAVINALRISMNVYMEEEYEKDAIGTVITYAIAITSVQLVLIYIPLIVVGVKGIIVVKRQIWRTSREEQERTEDFLAALEEQRLLDASMSMKSSD